jgi:hypothetical protein
VTVHVEVDGVPGTQTRVIDQTGVVHTGEGSVQHTTNPAASDWIRVEVRRGEQMVALTNPVFLRR